GKGIGNHFKGQIFETLYQTAQYHRRQLSEQPKVDLSVAVEYYKEALLHEPILLKKSLWYSFKLNKLRRKHVSKTVYAFIRNTMGID
ncbi:hypothetical protein LCGC14_2947080, partial [marine sediment metagenome]